MTVSRELEVDDLDDHDDFAADMAYLHSLSDFMIEVGLPGSRHLFYACGPTVEEQLLADLSPAARRAIGPDGWHAW